MESVGGWSVRAGDCNVWRVYELESVRAGECKDWRL